MKSRNASIHKTAEGIGGGRTRSKRHAAASDGGADTIGGFVPRAPIDVDTHDRVGDRWSAQRPVQVRAQADALEIVIYSAIGPSFFEETVSAADVIRVLQENKSVSQIDVFLNSPGGAVFDGIAIYNALVRHPATVTMHIDGMALSSASLVAMAGDTIRMAENAMMMIHEPWSIVLGNADDMRSEAGLLDQISGVLADTYAARSKLTRDDALASMTAETWFTAAEAVDVGLADEVFEAKRIAACGDLSVFRNVPAEWAAGLETQNRRCHRRLSDTEKENAMNDATETAPAPTLAAMGQDPAASSPAPPAPASTPAAYSEIVAACPGADEKFICRQLEGKATVEQARSAWMTEQNTRIQAADARAAQAAAAAKKPGVDLAGEGGQAAAGSGDYGTLEAAELANRWNALVDEKKKICGGDTARALGLANRADPELRQALVAAANASR